MPRVIAFISLLLLHPIELLAETQAQVVGSGVPEPMSGGTVIQWFLGLIIVLAIIFGSGWLLRKLGPGMVAGGGQLRILGGVSVGSREKVVLLQAGKKQLLVGVAPGQVRTLHVLDDNDISLGDGAPKAEETVSFADRLHDLTGRGGKQ